MRRVVYLAIAAPLVLVAILSVFGTVSCGSDDCKKEGERCASRAQCCSEVCGCGSGTTSGICYCE